MDYKIRIYIKPLESERENFIFIDRLEEAGISDWELTKYKDVEFISIPISYYLFHPDIDFSAILSDYIAERRSYLCIVSKSAMKGKWGSGRDDDVGPCYLANGVTGEMEVVYLNDFICRARGCRLGVIPSRFWLCKGIKSDYNTFCIPPLFRQNGTISLNPEIHRLTAKREWEAPVLGIMKPKIYREKIYWQVLDVWFDDIRNLPLNYPPNKIKKFFRLGYEDDIKTGYQSPTLPKIAYFYSIGGLEAIDLPEDVRRPLEGIIRGWIKKRFYSVPVKAL